MCHILYRTFPRSNSTKHEGYAVLIIKVVGKYWCDVEVDRSYRKMDKSQVDVTKVGFIGLNEGENFILHTSVYTSIPIITNISKLKEK